MDFYQIFLNGMRFAIPLLIFTLALIVHMPRRRYFWLRAIGSLVIYIGLIFLGQQIISSEWVKIGWLNLYFLIYVVYIVVAICLCFKIKLRFAAFFAISGYLLQHLFDRLHHLIITLLIKRNIAVTDAINWTIYGIIFAILLAVDYIFFARRTKKERIDALSERTSNVLFITLMIVSFLVVYVLSCYIMFGSHEDTLSAKIYGSILCIILLFTQYGIFDVDILSRDNKTLERVIETNQKQNLTMEENINYINMKMHDLKHIFEKMDEDQKNQEYMEEFKEVISTYENVLLFKNEALRSLLIEKTVQCKKENVDFTFLVDEKDLDFFSKADLISILGNALNNAIEAASKVQEGEHRYVNLDIATHGKLLQIHVENSYSGEINKVNDRILSSKKDSINHGFGMKSIFYITDKYKGIHSYKAGKKAFYLNLLFTIE